jgi:hypothetical protein
LSGELFVEQSAELEAEIEIGQVTEVLHTESAGRIDQQEGGSALELVGLHGERDAGGDRGDSDVQGGGGGVDKTVLVYGAAHYRAWKIEGFGYGRWGRPGWWRSGPSSGRTKFSIW